MAVNCTQSAERTNTMFQRDTSDNPKQAERAMEWLDYPHRRYVWTGAKEGSLARAAAKLRGKAARGETAVRGAISELRLPAQLRRLFP